MKHYNVGKDERTVNNHLKLALRAGVKNNSLKQAKGTGASGSFRLGKLLLIFFLGNVNISDGIRVSSNALVNFLNCMQRLKVSCLN